MMKKYIVFTLLLSLVGMRISVQAMGGEERRGGEETSATKCAICQAEEEVDLQTLGCGHEFHAECLGGYIRDAFSRSNTNFDKLKCPESSSHGLACAGVLTREEIDRFTSSSSSSAAGNADILAFFDERAAERANPPVINSAPADAEEIVQIAAGHLQICPECNRRAQRIDGCNHMTCSTDDGGCGIHYCYPCGTRYNPAINQGRGWGARACACPHFPNGQPEPIPVPGGRGVAMPQVNPMAIINAAAMGNLVQVQVLLAAGIEVNTQNNIGYTALYWAAMGGQLALVQALLAAPHIQVNTQDNLGITALHMAADQGHLEVVQALLAAGAQVNTPGNDGWTALHRAALKCHLEVVQALLADPDIEVNTPDNEGLTALHEAAMRGHLEVVRELLATHDIEVNTPDANGSTARNKAVQREFPEIVAAIDAHIAAQALALVTAAESSDNTH